MPDITVNGIDIHYETSGDGPRKLVFLHGFMLTCHIWDDVMKLMPSEFQCFALDTRGFGGSGKPTEGYSLPTLADDISCFLQEMNNEKTSIVGHSVSGPVAIYFGANRPNQVDSVVLVGTFARNSTLLADGSGGGEGMRELLNMFANPPEKVDRNLMENFLKFMVYDIGEIAPRMFDDATGYSSKAPDNSILMQTLMSPMGWDMEAELTKIERPLLSVHGPADTLFLFDEAKFMAEAVPHGELIIIDKSGHLPMIEQPEAFVAILTKFLTSIH